jgi:hypothetical protein
MDNYISQTVQNIQLSATFQFSTPNMVSRIVMEETDNTDKDVMLSLVS